MRVRSDDVPIDARGSRVGYACWPRQFRSLFLSRSRWKEEESSWSCWSSESEEDAMRRTVGEVAEIESCRSDGAVKTSLIGDLWCVNCN